jgi:hypothetical protein
MSHCVYSLPLDPMGIHLFQCIHGGEKMTSHDVMRDAFVAIARDWISCLAKTNPCPSAPYLVVFTLLNWHCAISQLCSNVSKHYNCQPHSSWFGLANYSFLWACYDSRDSFEGWCVSWLVPSRHVFPFNYKGNHMFTLVGRQVSSLMCQHGVGNERHWKPSFYSFVCIL